MKCKTVGYQWCQNDVKNNTVKIIFFQNSSLKWSIINYHLHRNKTDSAIMKTKSIFVICNLTANCLQRLLSKYKISRDPYKRCT